MARPRNEEGVPTCKLHPDSYVVRNGLYGPEGKRRQRWRCTPDNDGPHPGDPHNFTGINTARLVLEEPTLCASCEVVRHRHQGPSVVSKYRYPMSDVAQSLIRVGEGATYTEIARRIQRPDGPSYQRSSQLVRHWMDLFAPVVLKPFEETHWPKVIAIDSTTFYPAPSGKAGFSVLAAVGYDAYKDKGRVMALKAVEGAVGADNWRAFFKTLQGSPEVVITDRAKAQLTAATAVGAFPKPPVIRTCRWHELTEQRDLLTRDGTLIPYAKEVWELIERAPYHPRIWVRLMSDVAPYTASWNPHQQAQLARWYQARQGRILHDLFQGKMRGVSWGWTVGKTEWAIREVKKAIKARAFGLRNAYRTNLLLDLIRVRLNRQDRYDTYLTNLNALITDPATNLIPQRLHNDPYGSPSLHDF